MSRWRRIALEKIPECKAAIEQATNIMSLWFELLTQLEDAHREPVNEALIAKIYDYADWCLTSGCNDDIFTAVIVAFYEDLPTRPLVRKALPKWLSVDDFAAIQTTFHYHLDEEEYEAFLREFYAAKGINHIAPRRKRPPKANASGTKRKGK